MSENLACQIPAPPARPQHFHRLVCEIDKLDPNRHPYGGSSHLKNRLFYEKGPAYEKRHHHSKKRLAFIITGCAASGKTTLAHILAGLFSTPASQHLEGLDAEPQNNTIEETAATKVILVRQDNFRLRSEHCPRTQWLEHDPPIYAGDHPQDDGLNDSYWAAAFKANVGVSPLMVESYGDVRFPADYRPVPYTVIKKGSNMDGRMSIDWRAFLARANNGMTKKDTGEGITDCEEGRNVVKHYMDQMDPNHLIGLKSKIQEFIDIQTSKNSGCGFKGRAVVDGAIQDILIMEGPLLCIVGSGTEKLMDHCDIKIFLPTSKGVAIRRWLKRQEENGEAHERVYNGEARITEGYFKGVAWPEYMKEHQWLTLNGDIAFPTAIPSPCSWQHSVTILPQLDCSIRSTVWFAVEMILAKLAVEENFARIDFHQASQKDCMTCCSTGDRLAEILYSKEHKKTPEFGMASSTSGHRTAPSQTLRFETVPSDPHSAPGSSCKIRLTRRPAPQQGSPPSNPLASGASTEFQRQVDLHHSRFLQGPLPHNKRGSLDQDREFNSDRSPTARFTKKFKPDEDNTVETTYNTLLSQKKRQPNPPHNHIPSSGQGAVTCSQPPQIQPNTFQSEVRGTPRLTLERVTQSLSTASSSSSDQQSGAQKPTPQLRNYPGYGLPILLNHSGQLQVESSARALQNSGTTNLRAVGAQACPIPTVGLGLKKGLTLNDALRLRNGG